MPHLASASNKTLMETLLLFLREHHVIASGILGGIISALAMNWLYRNNNEPPASTADSEVYSHSRRTRIFMYVLAAGCFLMAALPAAALVYPDQWIPKIALIIGFGFGGTYCLLEVRRARVIATSQGITVQGAFCRQRTLGWNDVENLREHDTLQLLIIKGKNGQKLWISYMLGGFAQLIQRFNQHGLAARAQQPALGEMVKAITENKTKPQLAWFMLPFVSIWRVDDRHAAVLASFNDGEFTGFYVHYSQSMPGSPHQTMSELRQLIANYTACNDRELAQVLNEDITTLLADARAWP